MVFKNQGNNFNKNPQKNSPTPNNKTPASKSMINSPSINKHPVLKHILIKFKTKIKIKMRKVYQDTSTMNNCLNKFQLLTIMKVTLDL